MRRWKRAPFPIGAARFAPPPPAFKAWRHPADQPPGHHPAVATPPEPHAVGHRQRRLPSMLAPSHCPIANATTIIREAAHRRGGARRLQGRARPRPPGRRAGGCRGRPCDQAPSRIGHALRASQPARRAGCRPARTPPIATVRCTPKRTAGAGTAGSRRRRRASTITNINQRRTRCATAPSNG